MLKEWKWGKLLTLATSFSSDISSKKAMLWYLSQRRGEKKRKENKTNSCGVCHIQSYLISSYGEEGKNDS